MARLRVKTSAGGGLRDRLRKMTARRGPTRVSVGFLEGATYPDGTSVPTVAAAQEFGTLDGGGFIPPRPFFRSMIAEKQAEWGPAIALQLRRTGGDPAMTLGRVGEGIKGQLQQSILDTNDPPLAESTVQRKGFDKPLIDTAVMIRSVDYRVD